MIVFPAIDLRGGKVVRLRQGDPAAQTVYGDDPAQVARRWATDGAEWLHVVNLDGALGEASAPANLEQLAKIRATCGLPIQFGGGVRTAGDVGRLLELGATRVVLGTVAVRQPEVVAEALAHFGPEQIAVGIDARHGLVATAGWQSTSAVKAHELAVSMRRLGVRWVVYTDIARDGMLSGVNAEATAELARSSGVAVIASGGVAGLGDVEALRAHESDGVAGVVVGQALYTGSLSLRAAIQAARGESDANGRT